MPAWKLPAGTRPGSLVGRGPDGSRYPDRSRLVPPGATTRHAGDRQARRRRGLMKIGGRRAGVRRLDRGLSMVMQGVGSGDRAGRQGCRARAGAGCRTSPMPPLRPRHGRARGDYDALAGAGVVLLAPRASPRRRAETRLHLAGSATPSVFFRRSSEVLRAAPEAVLLVATNPVDIMTWIAQRLPGLPPERVVGSATVLDTPRFFVRCSDTFWRSRRSPSMPIVLESTATARCCTGRGAMAATCRWRASPARSARRLSGDVMSRRTRGWRPRPTALPDHLGQARDL